MSRSEARLDRLCFIGIGTVEDHVGVDPLVLAKHRPKRCGKRMLLTFASDIRMSENELYPASKCAKI